MSSPEPRDDAGAGSVTPAAAPRRTQAERRAATRAALIAAGRELFAARGYEHVGTEEIVAAAGVTRGALYHHFDGKRGLFAAVFEQVEAELVERFSLEDLTGADPFAALAGGVAQFLELSLDVELQQIALLDGPAVLGWEEWHEIESRYGLGLVRAGIDAAVAAGQIRELPAAELASALLGALIEAALYVARAEDQAAAKANMTLSLSALLEGLHT